jgi:hypothetical protein
MIRPRLSALRFATAVVAVECARDEIRSAVGERIAAALHERIGKVIGSGGFGVLLRRSLALAGRNHPILASVTVADRGSLTTASDPAPDPVAMQEAITALLATFVDLLAELIGDDLAFRLVGDAWPEISTSKATGSDEEKR